MTIAGAAGESVEGAPAYDRAALLSELFDQNLAALRRLAFALLGDASAADEVAQDAFVRLHSTWRRLDDPPTYLRRIVLNLCWTRGRSAALHRRKQVASVSSTEGTLWVAQQAPKESSSCGRSTRSRGGRRTASSSTRLGSLPSVVQYDGTVWFAQAVRPESRSSRRARSSSQSRPTPGGAWVTSGGDFVFRIAPTIEHSEELGPLGALGRGRYNEGVAGVAQW